jgi:hypothetical protein
MNPNCPYNPSDWINFCDYTKTEIVLVIIGTVFWIIAYYQIIRNGFKYKYIEMPFLAAASNLAWEFVWGFLVVTNMGQLFVWGLRIWFFMDVIIFYLILKYGDKQISNPIVKKSFKPLEISVCLYWIPVFYFMYTEGYDTPMGAISAYMITVVMASLFIFEFLSRPKGSYFSPYTGWMRLIGNSFMSIFAFMHYPEKHFLQLLCVAVFILNVAYVIIQQKHKDFNNNL